MCHCVRHLLEEIRGKKAEGLTAFTGLNGWRMNGGTVPPDLALTSQVPDLVLIEKSVTPTRVVLLELTVPWDSANSFQGAIDRKTFRLTEDLNLAGYNCLNMPLEIGCLGPINTFNNGVLAAICSMVGIKSLKV